MNKMTAKIEKNKCFFCQIIKEKEKYVTEKGIYLIAENKKSIAILDKFPISDGHVLLITKEHFSNISEVSDIESWNYLLPLMKEVIKKLKATLQPEGFNIISNMNENMEKKIAYQSIPHLHIHIIPKYEKNQGFIWTSNPVSNYSSLNEIADKIRNLDLCK